MPNALPNSLPNGPFTVQTGRDLGMTKRELYGRSVVIPFPGTRLPADGPWDLAARCGALALTLPDSSAFSHVTALRLQGIEEPWRLEADEQMHVVVRTAGDRPQRRGVTAHVASDTVLTKRVAGVQVTTPAQTWIHLAASLTVDELVVLGDAMTRRKAPACALEDLRAVLAEAGSRRGVRRAAEALPLIRPRTDSSMETRTRLVLVRGGLPCPQVNEDQFTDSGEFLAMPDMAYPGLKIAIEYAGDVHRDPDVWRRDVNREARMRDHDWDVITVIVEHVLQRPEFLVARVRRSMRAQSVRLGVPLPAQLV